jgi:hypothetical protein
MKHYRLHKYLVVLFFLTVLIPGEKIAIPVGLMVLFPLSNIEISILPIIGLLYLIASGIDCPDTKSEKIYTISSLLIFWGFLLYFSKAFIKYSSGESFVTLLLFVSVSLFLLVRLIRELKN